MNEQMQAMTFLAGANSIFYGEKLLTTPNPSANKDMELFAKLGIKPEGYEQAHCPEDEAAMLADKIQQQKDDAVFYNAAS